MSWLSSGIKKATSAVEKATPFSKNDDGSTTLGLGLYKTKDGGFKADSAAAISFGTLDEKHGASFKVGGSEESYVHLGPGVKYGFGDGEDSKDEEYDYDTSLLTGSNSFYNSGLYSNFGSYSSPYDTLMGYSSNAANGSSGTSVYGQFMQMAYAYLASLASESSGTASSTSG